jgi:hypothetical protein
MTFPQTDLVQLIRDRLEVPQELVTNPDPALMGEAVLRQLKTSTYGEDSKFRMSGLGACARELAFSYRDAPEDGRGINARARCTFAIGDMVEIFLTAALDEALATSDCGWKLEEIRGDDDGQAKVALDFEVSNFFVDDPMEIHVPGHPDGLLTHVDGARAVLEIKSTSSYSFSKWDQAVRKGEDPWTPDESYYWQIQGYMHTEEMNADWAYILAVGKDHGAKVGWWHKRDPQYMRMLQDHLEKVVFTSDPHKVPRTMPNGDDLYDLINEKTGELYWKCRYCNFYNTCWGDDIESFTKRDYRTKAPSSSLRLKS